MGPSADVGAGATAGAEAVGGVSARELSEQK